MSNPMRARTFWLGNLIAVLAACFEVYMFTYSNLPQGWHIVGFCGIAFGAIFMVFGDLMIKGQFNNAKKYK